MNALGISEVRKFEVPLQKLVDELSDVVILNEPDSKVSLVNQAYTRVLGYPVEKLLGRKPEEQEHFFTPEDKKKVIRVVDEVLRGEEAMQEVVYRHKDGQPVYARLTGRPLELNGKTMALWTITDFTELKRKEKDLKEANAMCDVRFSISTLPCLVMDRHRRWIRVNPAFERFTGYSAEEILGKFDYEMPFWPQEELIRLEELVKDKKPGEPITIETRMKNREGKSLRVLLSEVFVREEVSSKIGWIGYLTDVTELRQREEALKETNEFNQVLIDNLLAIVWMCDEEGRCCLVNKESARLLGWERGEFLGKLAPESPDICKSGLPYMKEGTLEALGEIWRKVIEKKELGMGDVPLLTKDSKIVIHRGVEIPYGKGEARLWMSTDITDLRKREAELRAIHDTSLKVSSSLELQQVLNLIVEGAVNLLDAEKAAILMLKDEEIGYRATYGFSPTSSRIKFKLGEGYIGQVALSGEPVIVSDAPSDP